MKNNTELKPCPFCGGGFTFTKTDEEGNLHEDSYFDKPFSGVAYLIDHSNEKYPYCPVANHPDEEGWGGNIFDNKEQAIKAWNARAEPKWRPIETAPNRERISFLVFVPKKDGDEYDCVVQVSNFEGHMYPDFEQCNVDWGDRVVDATHWMPMSELENEEEK